MPRVPCELLPERWAKWMAWDPLQLIEDPANQARLSGLRGLFIDCGVRDQYFLVFGARRLHRRLEELGIGCVYAEFDDTHSGIDYRMDQSLPYLYQCIA